MADDDPRFHALCELPLDDQVKAFLRAFVFDFQGNFGPVLTLAEEFKKFLKNPSDTEIDEWQAHLFLENHAETLTAQELRDQLAQIDLDHDSKLSLVEYLLFKYEKTVELLLDPPFAIPAYLTEALENAIDDHNKHWDERRARDTMYADLEKTASGSGVKALQAKAKFAAAKSEGWSQRWNMREVHSGAVARKAQSVVKHADKETLARQALEAEQKRLADIEADTKKQRRATRDAMRNRASMFEQAAPAAPEVHHIRAATVSIKRDTAEAHAEADHHAAAAEDAHDELSDVQREIAALKGHSHFDDVWA